MERAGLEPATFGLQSKGRRLSERYSESQRTHPCGFTVTLRDRELTSFAALWAADDSPPAEQAERPTTSEGEKCRLAEALFDGLPRAV